MSTLTTIKKKNSKGRRKQGKRKKGRKDKQKEERRERKKGRKRERERKEGSKQASPLVRDNHSAQLYILLDSFLAMPIYTH